MSTLYSSWALSIFEQIFTYDTAARHAFGVVFSPLISVEMKSENGTRRSTYSHAYKFREMPFVRMCWRFHHQSVTRQRARLFILILCVNGK